MTDREFLQRLANGSSDPLGVFLKYLDGERIPFCLIGGLAVNAYVEPVVSMDVDVVIVTDRIDAIIDALKGTFAVERFANSVNFSAAGSDLRIQIQTDPRYQPFIGRATVKKMLGYDVPVAGIEDLIDGKVWAASDSTRRASKRQKDLADIARLIETDPRLAARVPADLRSRLLGP